MKVAYIAKNYPEKRLIIDRAHGVDYVFVNKRKSIRFIIARLFEKICKICYAWDANSIFSPLFKNLNGIDLIHSFNTVCRVKKKWVITYESVLPRTKMTTYKENLWMRENVPVDRITLDEIELLADENCAKIIAISESAKKVERRFLEIYAPNHAKAILDKITVILPPQRAYASSEFIKLKYTDIDRKKIKFIFVGRHFFIKGCDILIDVMKTLHEKYDFELILVSSMEYANWLDYSNQVNMEKYKRLIDSFDWVTWYPEVPNNKVIEFCKECDVGLFPSFNDTFGYSVLEMQACGCPVVTTNIRAFNEINNEMCGWICKLAVINDLSVAVMDTDASISQNRESLKNALNDIFKDILENPEQIQDKANNSLKRIQEYHDPDKYSETLNGIYKHS